MTTKTIKSFCVNTQRENLTEDQVRELHKWCVEAGASEYENINIWLGFLSTHPFLGVDEDSDVISENYTEAFNDNIILFEDVLSHLGLGDSQGPKTTSCEMKDCTFINTISVETLKQYSKTLNTDISITKEGFFVVFMENFCERDIVLKTEKELEDFVSWCEKLNKFIDNNKKKS